MKNRICSSAEKRASSGQSPWIVVVIVVVILGIFGIMYYFVLSQNFEVTNLEVIPPVVKPGEDIMISVDVKNTGWLAGTHEVTLEIDGLPFSSENVELSSGENKPVDFRVFGYLVGEGRQIGIGTHQVEVDGQTATFRVLKPATFEISDLEINPREVEPGENVYISVSVMNSGEIEGIATIPLRIEGEVEATSMMMIEEGEERKVSFTVTKENEGTYEVEVNGLSGSFKVTKPPEFPSSIVILITISIAVSVFIFLLFISITVKRSGRRGR